MTGIIFNYNQVSTTKKNRSHHADFTSITESQISDLDHFTTSDEINKSFSNRSRVRRAYSRSKVKEFPCFKLESVQGERLDDYL